MMWENLSPCWVKLNDEDAQVVTIDGEKYVKIPKFLVERNGELYIHPMFVRDGKEHEHVYHQIHNYWGKL